MKKLVFLLTLISSLTVTAADEDKDKRGLLPELKMDGVDEDKNEIKQLSSELMISRAEDKAITSLQALLKKNKNTAQEPDLLYRLAELYMRKAKTGRFFDLNQDSKTLKLSPFPIPPQKGKDWLRKAIATYNNIENRYPKFGELDGVLFNNAFAHQQVGNIKGSEVLYRRLLTKFPNSSLVPDGLMALGELLYDQARFKDARTILEDLERFPNARVYSYGLYKLAWTYYNLKLSDQAINKLVEVVQKNPFKIESMKRYNLRNEALRDLVVFVGDSVKASNLYSFFKKITVGDELGEAMINLAKLYQTYNREKDIHIFLNEFLDQQKNHSYRVRAHMILVTANETLKRRDEVLEHLDAASKLCEPNAIWRAKQEPAWGDETCQKDFRKTSLEIADKWWGIWLKNKSHTEFSKLTEKSLRLVLRGDDEKKPDYKTRYGLAELLFQQGIFEEASQHYEMVGATSQEATMVHDANYAALYSMQKAIEAKKSKDKKLQERLKKLSLHYIEKHPKGQHALPVQLQVAIAEYEINNDKEAEKYLTPLTQQKQNIVVRRKAQDLLLDIYNHRKDYPTLKAMASEYLKESDQAERKASLQKIYEEAHYADVQDALKKKPKIEVAEMLIEFRKTHPKSKLSKEALWQALSLAYSEGYSTRGADLAFEFSQTYSDDKRTADALRESANSYLLTGRIDKALEIYRDILKTNPSDKRKLQDAIIDLYVLEGKKSQARQMIRDMMKSASGSDKRILHDRLVASFSEDEKASKEYKEFEKQLVDQGVEPYSTQHLTRLARQHFENKKYPEAFQAATRAMARDTAMEHRAEARYIQARILEHELINQSIKTSKEDRLALVLNIKTEKLDKALTAYNSASKMTKDPALMVQVLEGVGRVYNNYITSLREMELPASLSEADIKTLRDEIEKITFPVEEKLKENKMAMADLLKRAPASEDVTHWSDLRPEETVPVGSTGPSLADIKAFLPDSWKAGSGWDLHTNRKPKCRTGAFAKDKDFSGRAELMADCFLAKNWKVFESEALALTDTPTYRAWGLFYLALLSEQQNLLEKSLWLTEKALELSKDNEVFQYQKARALGQVQNNLKSALPEFAKLFNSKNFRTEEISALKGLHYAQLGDWGKAKEALSGFSKDALHKYKLVVLYAEAQNRTGNVDEAVSVISNSKLKNTLDAWLYLGKIFEIDKPELGRAQDSYKKALALSTSAEQKSWLEKKLEYLNNLKK